MRHYADAAIVGQRLDRPGSLDLMVKVSLVAGSSSRTYSRRHRSPRSRHDSGTMPHRRQGPRTLHP
jgi:hypothetical protein